MDMIYNIEPDSAEQKFWRAFTKLRDDLDAVQKLAESIPKLAIAMSDELLEKKEKGM